jgi:hypothetical protein
MLRFKTFSAALLLGATLRHRTTLSSVMNERRFH